jgi:hypothetical protein
LVRFLTRRVPPAGAILAEDGVFDVVNKLVNCLESEGGDAGKESKLVISHRSILLISLSK